MSELPPVDVLSDDEEQCNLPQPAGSGPATMAPITDLTDESSNHSWEFKECGMARKRKRKKRDGPSPSERLVSEPHCKALLGRLCKSCKRHCLSDWLSKGKFQEVIRFRVQWSATHKLDQDKIVAKSQFRPNKCQRRFLLVELPVLRIFVVFY